MTTPVTGIELVIETDEVARGRREWIEACQDIQAEAKNTERTFREVGDADRVLMEEMRALSKQIEDLRNPLRDVADASRQSEAATRESTAATKEWIEGLKELIPKVEEAETETGQFSRAASILGGVIGGFIANATLSLLKQGMELAAQSIREIGRAAREERERIEELRESLERLANERRRTAQDNLRTLENEAFELRERIASLRPNEGISWRAGVDTEQVKQVAKLQQDLKDLEEQIRIARRLATEESDAAHDRLAGNLVRLITLGKSSAEVEAGRQTLIARTRQELERQGNTIDRQATLHARLVSLINAEDAAAKKAREEAARRAREALRDTENRQQSLAQLSITEIQLAAETAGNLRDELRLRREIIDRGIDEQVRRMKGLTDEEREREIANRKAIQDAKDYAAEQDRIREAEKDRLDQLRNFMKENKALLDALRFGPSMWQRQQLGKPVEVASELPKGTFGLGDAQRAASKGANRDEREAEREQVKAYREKIEAIQAAGNGIADLSQQLWGLDDASANAIRAITNLVASIAEGDVGGIITGAVGLVGSLFGDGGREERQRAREARAAQLDDINRFIDSITPRGNDIEELTKSYQDLHAEGKRLGLGNHELARLTQAYANELVRLQEVEYRRNMTAQEDLDIRALEAQGRSEEAQARRFALQQQREMSEYLQAGYNAATIATLAYAQAMEAEAEARRIAREQLEEERQRRDVSSDFTVRSLRLEGNDEGADIAEIHAAWERERDRITDLFTSGILNEQQFRDWIQLIGGEAAEAVREITERYRDQTRAIDESLDSMQAQAILDIARVKGDTEAIQAIQARIREEQKRQQIEEAIRQGYTDAQIARLEYIQGLQDEATAMQEAADAAAEAARLFQDQADAYEDLAIRRLKVQGLGGAASEAALVAQQQREIREAEERGFSAQYIVDLIALQKDEREKARLDNQARQQAEFDRAAAANAAAAARTETAADSRTTFSLAVGTSETTSNALRGLMQKDILIQERKLALQQRYLPYLALLEQMAGGMSPAAIQQAVIEGTEDSDRAFGKLPSN